MEEKKTTDRVFVHHPPLVKDNPSVAVVANCPCGDHPPLVKDDPSVAAVVANCPCGDHPPLVKNDRSVVAAVVANGPLVIILHLLRTILQLQLLMVLVVIICHLLRTIIQLLLLMVISKTMASNQLPSWPRVRQAIVRTY